MITNDALKYEIMEIYNSDYWKIARYEDNMKFNIREYGRPIVRRRMKRISNNGATVGFQPLNYDVLRSDIELWNLLGTLQGNNLEIKNLLIEISIKIRKLVQMIDEEIK